VVLGALSIGILVVPAGIFATIALTRRRAHPLVVAAGIALALLIAVAGLAWTPD
jgi:biopolymer transport protein ExbB/TolQ